MPNTKELKAGAEEYERRFFQKKVGFSARKDGLSDIKFQSVLDCAYKAALDQKINISFMSDVSLYFHSREKPEDGDFEVCISEGEEWFGNAITFIQSLYKQPFVIKNEEDIARITGGCEVTLSNGNKTTVEGWVMMEGENRILLREYDHPVWFFILKGATVEYPK